MSDETSIGIAIFRRPTEAELEFLLLKHPEGHWDFPKGHTEVGETEQRTAARELAEETGLDPHKIQWEPEFRHSVNYRYAPSGGEERSKEVHYLAASTDEDPGMVQLSEEHTAWGWFDPVGTKRRLTYESSRQVLGALLKRLAVSS